MDFVVEDIESLENSLKRYIILLGLQDAVCVHQEAKRVLGSTASKAVLQRDRYVRRELETGVCQCVLDIGGELLRGKQPEQMRIDVSTPVGCRDIGPVEEVDIAKSLLLRLRGTENTESHLPNVGKAH